MVPTANHNNANSSSNYFVIMIVQDLTRCSESKILFNKLVELEQGLSPTRIMVDFEKAAINALEDNCIFVFLSFPDDFFIVAK